MSSYDADPSEASASKVLRLCRNMCPVTIWTSTLYYCIISKKRTPRHVLLYLAVKKRKRSGCTRFLPRYHFGLMFAVPFFLYGRANGGSTLRVSKARRLSFYGTKPNRVRVTAPSAPPRCTGGGSPVVASSCAAVVVRPSQQQISTLLLYS